MPTLLALPVIPNIKSKLMAGYTVGDMTYQGPPRRLQLPALADGPGKDESPRKEFFYFSDDGDLTAPPLRQLEGRVRATDGPSRNDARLGRALREDAAAVAVQPEQPTRMRRASTITSNTYWDWYLDHVFLLVPAQAYVGDFLKLRSGNSRRVRRRPASRSTRSWNNCRTPGPPTRVFPKANRTKGRSTLKAGRSSSKKAWRLSTTVSEERNQR